MGDALKKEEITAELWRRGELSWKLHTAQAEIYHQFRGMTGGKRFVLNCSRRIGKSFFLNLLGTEQCIRKPHSMVRMAAPKQKSLKKIVLPLMRVILNDCPDYLEPRFHKADNVFEFPNGSEIHLAGCDNGHEEDLRGTNADLCIVDEAGFVDNLDYVVRDILTPQLMYNPEGRIILGSTPPKSPAHDFVQYLMEGQINGNYAHRTIYDNPLINESVIDEYAKECGGYDTTTFKREYLAQVITEETAAIIPEFNEERERQIVMEWPRPEEFHVSTIGDLGFRDATVMLLGYYDFKAAKVIIEDEIVMNGPSSSEIARAIKSREKKLWGEKEPWQRFADGDLICLHDISKEHNVGIRPVKKDVLDAQVNHLRLDVLQDNVRINPRCKTTIAHLKYGIWDKQRKKFDRSDKHFHFDGLAALIYFVRMVDRNSNPFPWDHGGISHATHHIPVSAKNPERHEWRKLAGGR